MQIRAVAFDIDGTLYPSWPMYFGSAFRAFFHVRFINAFARVRREIRDVYPIDDFHELQNTLLGKALNVPPERAGEMIRHWMDVELDAVYRRLRPFAYTRTCIESLRERGVKTAVLSDFPVGAKLSYLGLEGLWECVHSAEDSGYLKPRSEPFGRMIDCLDESPEHIVYIGNNYEYDIVGARNAGMMTAYLTNRSDRKNRRDSRESTFIFSGYRDLASTLLEFVR